MSEALRGKSPSELSPYEAVLRSFAYLERVDSAEHAEVRACLEEAIKKAPDDADCLASLSMSYADEHKHGFNVRPHPLDRALEAARRAVQAAPSSHLAYYVLAQALFFRRELQDFRVAAERAVALNPMDGDTKAFMGILMAYAGDWEHGVALAEKALSLNPHHPGWYRFAAAMNAYRKSDYRSALDIAQKMNMPSYFATHAALAAAYGQLGDDEAARRAAGELLTQKPGFAEVGKPDGSEIAFTSNRHGGVFDVYSKPIDGNGRARRWGSGDRYHRYPTSWSPDGGFLAFSEDRLDAHFDIGLLLDDGEPTSFLATPFNERGAQISPNGRFVAYVSNDTGRDEIHVRPVRDPGRATQISIEGGQEPLWSRDGRELFYRNGNAMMSVSVETAASFTAGTPARLFERRYDSYILSIRPNYDVSADGQTFLMIRSGQESQPRIHVVVDWGQELERLVTTDN